MLPTEPSVFGVDGWQTRLSELFPAMASAPALTRNAPSGTLCRMMVQVLDQMESEIFFPVVNVRHQTTGVVKPTVAVFRERLDDEEGEIVDPADFSAASERRVYKIGVKLDDHNGDKGDYKVALKLYDSCTKVDVLQIYEVVGIYYPEQQSVHVVEMNTPQVDHVQTDAILPGYDKYVDMFAKLLHGDELAAKVVLASMVSEVYLRRDVLCLGKYSVHLNAKALSNEEVGEIIVALRNLHPQAIVLNLSRECLNEATFTPVKNYETEELEHSRLSLPNGTLLIIDETRLTPGQLNEVGTRNITALGKLITEQRLAFDYKFYQKDFDVKVNCLIVSQGKSILPNDFSINLKPDEIEPATVDTDEAKQFKLWLHTVKEAKYKVDNDEIVQNFIVDTRKADSQIGIEQLHQIMVTSRALAIARGQSAPTIELLEEARSMTKKMLDRPTTS